MEEGEFSEARYVEKFNLNPFFIFVPNSKIFNT